MILGVVIPVFHGYGTVGGVTESVLDFAKCRGITCRVALVADGGGDRDAAAVRALQARYENVTAVVLPENRGQQQALYAGLRELRGCDLIATMDDDGAHPAALLGDMIAAVQSGADLCYAVPERRKGTPLRRLGARLRDGFFSFCLGMPRGVRAGAYRVMTGTLAARIAPEADGTIYLSAAAMKLHPRVACVRYRANPGGAPSRYTFGKLAALYAGLLRHYAPTVGFRRGARAAKAEAPRGRKTQCGR